MQHWNRKHFKRVILKLSGEALAGAKGYGIDPVIVDSVARQIKETVAHGSAGRCRGGRRQYLAWTFRQFRRHGSEPQPIIWACWRQSSIRLALQDALEQCEVDTRVQTAIEMRQIAEPYIRTAGHSPSGKRSRVVIFAAGTGNPYFSTDTTAALRAAEIEADVILMAKKECGWSI